MLTVLLKKTRLNIRHDDACRTRRTLATVETVFTMIFAAVITDRPQHLSVVLVLWYQSLSKCPGSFTMVENPASHERDQDISMQEEHQYRKMKIKMIVDTLVGATARPATPSSSVCHTDLTAPAFICETWSLSITAYSKHCMYSSLCVIIAVYVLSTTQRSGRAPEQGASPEITPLAAACNQGNGVFRQGGRRGRDLLAQTKREKNGPTAIRGVRDVEETVAAQSLSQSQHIERGKLPSFQSEARKRARRALAAADEHTKKADIMYRGWLPWEKRVHDMHLKVVKASRHHQYSVTHSACARWVSYLHHVRKKSVLFQASQV